MQHRTHVSAYVCSFNRWGGACLPPCALSPALSRNNSLPSSLKGQGGLIIGLAQKFVRVFPFHSRQSLSAGFIVSWDCAYQQTPFSLSQPQFTVSKALATPPSAGYLPQTFSRRPLGAQARLDSSILLRTTGLPHHRPAGADSASQDPQRPGPRGVHQPQRSALAPA